MTTLPAPAGTVCNPEPELYVYCADVKVGEVFCRDQSTVLELTVPPELSVTTQYMVPELVELAFTVPVTAVLAEVGVVKDTPEPLASFHW
jgi:hypothetical protein